METRCEANMTRNTQNFYWECDARCEMRDILWRRDAKREMQDLFYGDVMRNVKRDTRSSDYG
eukprot:scaffold35882_cov64-Attheya_sp.AAC.2